MESYKETCEKCRLVISFDLAPQQCAVVRCPNCKGVIYSRSPEGEVRQTPKKLVPAGKVKKAEGKQGAPDDWIAAPVALSDTETDEARRLLNW